MSVISLLTDFGLKDNFVGAIKAVILRINPKATIVDICHEVKPYDLIGAAFLLKSAFEFFPPGTVHLAVVDPGVGSKRKKVLVKTENYFFIGPDNGVLSLALKDERPLRIIEITEEKYFLKPTSDTFHGRDIFAPVCGYLSKGEDFQKFGKPAESLELLELPPVKVKSRELNGEVIYIDRFGNAVSNIDKDTFMKFVQDKRFKIFIKSKSIEKLSHSYSERADGQPLALIDSFGFLEIALNRGRAAAFLGIDKGTKIKVTGRI